MGNQRLCTVLVLLVIIVAASYAQLTFTPAWGKRAGPSASNGGNGRSGDAAGNVGNTNEYAGGSDMGACHTNTDSLMLIHHIVQLEAQKMLECHSKDANGY